MRSALFLAVGLVTACKGEPFRPDAGPEIDAYKPPWFFPAPGEVTNWDIQINQPYDLTTTRAMMVVDLWDFATAQTIMYADGSTLNVAAGVQAGGIDTLKAAGTKVICHVGTGAMRLEDPDAMKFPGYVASPPNRPDPIAAGSSIGWSTSTTDANERFVDFRNATAADVLLKRVKLAKDIGCDGILAYRNDAAAFGPTEPLQHGFSTEITSMVQTDWIVKVAKTGHDLMISVGGRGGHAEANIGEIDDDYDFLVAERCTEIPNCDLARPFIEAHHAVFGLDYTTDDSGAAQTIDQLCTDWTNGMIDGVMKSVALDSSVHTTCI